MRVGDAWDDEGFGKDNGLSKESIEPDLDEDKALLDELEDAEPEDDLDDEP